MKAFRQHQIFNPSPVEHKYYSIIFICTLRTRHAIVTGTYLSWVMMMMMIIIMIIIMYLPGNNTDLKYVLLKETL